MNTKPKSYKTIESWTKAMRKDTQKKLWADWFKIGGHWYVCEEYDESGKYMRYTSVTAWQHIDIDTANRYSSAWLSDMQATAYPIEQLRFSILNYFDDPKDFKAWVKNGLDDKKKVPYNVINTIQDEMQKGVFHAQDIISKLIQ